MADVSWACLPEDSIGLAVAENALQGLRIDFALSGDFGNGDVGSEGDAGWDAEFDENSH